MKKLFIAFAILVSTSISNAADSSSGCGLGWEVFKENSLVSSFLRSITNAFASNTIAMTFGTSNCAKHDIVQKDLESLHYAEANYHNLMVEMAKGEGQFVEAFAQTVGCKGLEKEFSNQVQKNYSAVFGATPQALVSNVKKEISNNASLALNCRAI